MEFGVSGIKTEDKGMQYPSFLNELGYFSMSSKAEEILYGVAKKSVCCGKAKSGWSCYFPIRPSHSDSCR